MTALIELDDVKVHYGVRKGVFARRLVGVVHAVDGVSITIDRGETLGLVGESGSGKTTLGRAILRVVEPTHGRVLFHRDGKPVDLRGLERAEMRRMWRHMQLIFQDPYASLNPRMTVRDIIAEPLVANGIGNAAEIADRVADMVRRVGLSLEHLGRYPHAFSGGQRQRISIARALVLRPEFIVCDEPVSALDVSIQAQILNLLKELQEELGLTYLFIAHDLAAVSYVSDRVAVMYLGQIVELAPTSQLYYAPRHPYTEALMSAIPVADPDRAMRPQLLPGERPDPANPPSGCRFHTRCPYADAACRNDPPALVERAAGHWVACHHADRLTLRGATVDAAVPQPALSTTA
ncbi:MAG: ATP-binding cassette domain-containing protein [Alphaproteobacteria bacterium]|nr:ATP-binding cassette domain-containing protein [Alphaproteobacteria bacterium]